MAENRELVKRNFNPKCGTKKCKQDALYAINEHVFKRWFDQPSNIRYWLFDIHFREDYRFNEDLKRRFPLHLHKELEKEADEWCCKKCLFRNYLTDFRFAVLYSLKYDNLCFEEHPEYTQEYCKMPIETQVKREIAMNKCWRDAKIDAKKTIALLKTLVKTI